MKKVAGCFEKVVIFALLMMVFPFASEVVGQSTDKSNVNWVSFAEAAKQADAEEKKLMIFLEAEWCMVCKRMHEEVFTKSNVFSLLNRGFYPVRMDIESDTMIPVKGKWVSKKEFSKDIGIYGTPTILFLNSNEEVIGNFVGYSDAEDMINLLTYIASDAYLTESLESYINP